MSIISNNNIIKVNCGDNFEFPVLLNIGSGIYPDIYFLKDVDRVFLSICEANQPFQDGIIRKIASRKDQDKYGYVTFNFTDNDTINLLPGTYYYEVKLIKNATLPYRSESLTEVNYPSCSKEHEILIQSAKLDVFYCDCNAFATILIDQGSTDNLSKHIDAQISESLFNDFDTLTTIYRTFLNNYNIDDNFNEYKLIPNTSLFNIYSEIFDLSKDIFLRANINLPQDVKSTIKTSGIIGINKPFIISQKDYFYSKGDYQTVIANILGYDDIQTFKDYTQILVETFISSLNPNDKRRLRFDGAIYTLNNCFVLPYVFKNADLTTATLGLIILEPNGNMSIWVDDIDNLFKSANFNNILSVTDLVRLDIYGRCTLFEILENYNIQTIVSKRKFILMD